jgi:hypothetical protein
MKRLFITMLLSAVVINFSYGQLDYGFDFSKAGTAGFQFLKIGVGARESALGEAAASITNDANSVFWNVGALPFVRDRQAIITHNQWLAGTVHDAAVVAVPLGSYVIAGSVIRLAIEDFEETTVLAPEGTGRMVSAGDILIGVAVARRFTDRLTIGIQAKYVQETLDMDSFNNVLFDVGALYYTGFRQLRLGFSLQHFGPDMKVIRQTFRMPLLFRLSAADDLVVNENYRITSSFDLVHPTDNIEWYNAGLEIELYRTFVFRGGYRFRVDEGNMTLGFGLQPPAIGMLNTRFDYAYVKYGDIFGATHRFSVYIGF